MSVANNLIRTTTLAKHELVTIDRPVIIDYQYTGSGTDIPVICEVQAWGNIQGVWTRMGSPLFANRTSESTAAAPKFRLNFADVIGRHLNDTFKKVMTVSSSEVTTYPPANEAGATVNQSNDSSHPDAEGMTSVKFNAYAWCTNSDGYLEKTDADGVGWNDSYYVNPVRVTLPPSFISGSGFNNLIGADGKMYKGVCDVTDLTIAANQPNRFATNAPRGLRRIMHYQAPLPLGLMVYNQLGTVDMNVSFHALKVTDGSAVSADTSLAETGTGNSFSTYLCDPHRIAPILSGITSSDEIRSDISMKLDLTSSNAVDTLDFAMVGHTTKYVWKENSKPIYWINDFNCLDFYTFDGALDINYESKSTNYVRNKDYSVRRDRDSGVFRGVSTEVVTVLSTALNKEALIWLQEIGRSRSVYEFDIDNKVFIPILVDDFKTTVLSTANHNAYSVEVSYKRDVISTR